jgi:hypothetical protein
LILEELREHGRGGAHQAVAACPGILGNLNAISESGILSRWRVSRQRW